MPWTRLCGYPGNSKAPMSASRACWCATGAVASPRQRRGGLDDLARSGAGWVLVESDAGAAEDLEAVRFRVEGVDEGVVLVGHDEAGRLKGAAALVLASEGCRTSGCWFSGRLRGRLRVGGGWSRC
jgi:hypothetical protein